MKNYKFDINYQQATNPNSEFVWISASAGTGKTRMLVHRVVRLLVSGQKNVLCLTFTNAAAHEIRERIYDIASRWLLLPENVLLKELEETCYQYVSLKQYERARRLFFHLHNLLKVQTVHSFCHSLISSFPTETGVPSDFKVQDLSESYPRLFTQLLKESRSIDPYLQEISAELKDNTIYDLIYTIASRRARISDIPKFEGSADLDSIESPLSIINALKCGSTRDQKISAKLSKWNNQIRKLPEDVENFLKVFIDLHSLEKKPISSISSKQTLLKFPEITEIIEEEQERLMAFAEKFYTERILERTYNLGQIANQFLKLYQQDKQHLRYLDYTDVIEKALELISHLDHKDWVLFCLDSKIDHILVDEAQDNSLEQWNIIAELCNEFFSGLGSKDITRTLFIVGDVKQSIYSFQNARPDYFHLMQQYFSQKSSNPIIIHLRKSFRSTKPILLLVDAVCNTLKRQISFCSQEIKHETHRDLECGHVEVWPLLSTEKEQKPCAWEICDTELESTNSMLLATTIAKTISTWLSDSRMLVAKERPVRAGDILILVRHRSVFVDQIISTLKKENIPTLGRDRFNIMDYAAIQDLVNLGEFLLLPDNDVVLATLLKSPIFRRTDEDLLDLVSSCKDSLSLWSRLQKSAALTPITEHLKWLIHVAKNHSPLNVYYTILAKHKKDIIRYLGPPSEEVIDEFINLLIKFESNYSNTLESFIHWIKSSNPETKSNTSISENSVKIMTVHGAKGMQAPIVFLPDTTSVPKCELQLVFDEQNIPFWCMGETNTYCKNLKAIKRTAEYDEYLRLLYVAMTRAEDELYIAGAGSSCGKSWYDIIANASAELFTKKPTILFPMFTDAVDVMYITTTRKLGSSSKT